MTNTTTTLTGTIENIERFHKFAFVLEEGSKKTAILYRDVLEASGFLPDLLTAASRLVVEVTDAPRGPKVIKVTSVNDVAAQASVEQPAVEVEKPKRSLRKRARKVEPHSATTRPLQFSLKQGEHATGRVKANFNHEKGFGFLRVTSHSGHPDVFVHVTMIQDLIYQEVLDGREVVFSIGSDEHNGEIRFFAVVIDLVATLAEAAA